MLEKSQRVNISHLFYSVKNSLLSIVPMSALLHTLRSSTMFAHAAIVLYFKRQRTTVLHTLVMTILAYYSFNLFSRAFNCPSLNKLGNCCDIGPLG